MQNLFRYYFSKYPDTKLPLKDLKAVESIINCNTLEQGYNYLACPEGHSDKVQVHSCHHRSCPLCADKARFQWIEAEKSRLLSCPHYHVIFTIPHEYLNLWQYNRKWFAKLFFKACRDTLIELMKDKKYLGATPGILMTLHTWGRQLNYHPHIHCLVTAGGFTNAGQWKATEGDFLLPIQVVKTLFRGKLQSWIRQGLIESDITLPAGCSHQQLLNTHRSLYKKSWSVRIQEQYEHGRGVALYLARYMKGGPIRPEQIISCHRNIRFYYRDHRDQKKKVCTLALNDFIKRVLWHVPEIGLHVVRHYGLYAAKNKIRRENYQAAAGQYKGSENKIAQPLKDAVNWCCLVCGEPLKRMFTTYHKSVYENSTIKSLRPRIVQQGDEDDRARETAIRNRWQLQPSGPFFRSVHGNLS